jgi:hypothetical protein
MNMPRTGLAPFKTQTRGPAPVERRKSPMMADGGFGAPSPIGDETETAPPAPDMGELPPPDPGAGAGGDSPIVKPESVHYHDDLWRCDGCVNFDAGQCSLLRMQVAPEGACNGWEGSAAGDDESAEPMLDDESMEGEELQ